MNFDFLKGLNCLDVIYKSSNPAEQLVRSDPSSSAMLSRKSAEMLARFVYLAAYEKEAQFLSFVDILNDPKVRNFINNRNVINAFQFIRKTGNIGAHTTREIEEKQAVSVLQNLHYVVGEIAKELDLISDYPDFDDNIGLYPDATADMQIVISKEVRKMFVKYIQEHPKDEHGRLVTVDLCNPAHWDYVIHGRTRLHERIEFEHQPYYQSTLEYLQKYMCFMFERAEERDIFSDESCTARVTITINGKVVPKNEWHSALMKQLPQAQSFAIDLYADGNFRAFYDNPDSTAAADAIDEEELWQGRGMADYLESLKRREAFTYKGIFRYADDDSHTEFYCIRNGKSYDVADLCKPDIVQRAKGCAFYGEMMMLHADFDHHAHMPILQQLRDAVRAYVPPEALPQLEENWEELEEEDSYGYLLTGNSDIDNDDDLTGTQHFIDQVNQILAPIADQCTIYMDYPVTTSKSPRPDPALPVLRHCFYNMQNFAVAAFIWKDQRLQLVGTIL